MVKKWNVNLARKAKKQYIKLKYNGMTRPSLLDAVDTLIDDLIYHGPNLKEWPNYGFIDNGKKNSFYHCHLKKGRPTFVACWKVIDENEMKIEVFYVGTHESAPY